MSKRGALSRSFKFAFSGFKIALKQEPNFRIHIIIGILALIVAAYLKFSAFEWLLLFFTIAFVLILELVNTSLEAIVNLVSPEKRGHAKIAKDVSAAAVLLAAILSIIVGVVLFASKISLY